MKEIIVGIRNIRSNMNVHPSKKSKLIFVTKEDSDFIEKSQEWIKKLGFADEIEIKDNKNNILPNSVNVVTSGIEVFIPFEDLVDVKAETERLEKDKEKIIVEKAKTDGMLLNDGFMEKAPHAKIEEEKRKLQKFIEMIKSIEERIRELNI
jgi:valyl-tRNA synthetase